MLLLLNVVFGASYASYFMMNKFQVFSVCLSVCLSEPIIHYTKSKRPAIFNEEV